MEKEKTRGRTRRKQPSQVAGFLYREGRKWCAAALSLCMILNNMASVTWAAESAAEKEVLFKLTSRSLYEALQEAVREETMVDDHFLFAGKEKDVEAYEKLLLLDDDLYELKPEFENKDEVTNAEKKNDLQLRIFASLGWETDPEREYQVVGDEKIIFCLSNASETEQTAVIQVDEKTTEEIVLVPGSAVVIDSKSEEESLEAESGDERKEDEEQEETESGESEGQAEEENNSEGVKGVGGNSSAGGASGGNGGNSGDRGNSSDFDEASSSGESSSSGEFSSSGESSNSGESGEKEDFVESGSSAEGDDSVENDNSVEDEGSAGNENSEENENSVGNENSTENENSAEDEGKADESAADAEENRDDETQEKAEEKDGREDEEVKDNSTSEKEETDKADAESNESGKSDKPESVNNESEKTDKEESGNADSGKADKADKEDKPDKTDKSDNKESSKPETSKKSESENTKTDKEEKSDTGKAENERSEKSDSSKKSESSKDSSNSGGSDNSSDKGKEVSAGISRNVIHLVADNLEVSASDDMEETESAEETIILDTQEEQEEEIIEEESEEIKAETASPSDVEDDAIEGELYAPVVVNEESIIVFVTTAEELGLNRAELRKASNSNAERVSPAFEKEVELENVIVQVRADEDVLPEGVTLQVKELKEDGDHAEQYEEAKEALDSKGTEYDGMIALDISFLDKKGREIEPDGNVQVSIKVKKEALPEEADLESIAVQHLAEDEGEVLVEQVADHGDKTEGKVEVQAEEHVEAAFEVNSFSVFTVTWVTMTEDGNKHNKIEEKIANFDIHFYYVDENNVRQPIDESRITVPKELKPFQEETIKLNEYFSNAVQGYDYSCAEFSTIAYDFIEITDTIKLLNAAESEGTKTKTITAYQPIRDEEPDFESGMYKMVFRKKSDYQTPTSVTEIQISKHLGNLQSPIVFPYLITMKNKNEEMLCPSGTGEVASDGDGNEYLKALDITLDLYFTKADLGILNTIAEDGFLTADRELRENEKYVWYKWDSQKGKECPVINGSTERDPKYQVTARPITGDKWNIEEDGKKLNVALDEGSNCYYLLAIKNELTDEETIASRPFFVEYSDKLENSSFEFPDLSEMLNYHMWYQYQNGYDGLIWKSTTGDVEIVNQNSGQHNLEGNVPQGKQCAELNPESAGALYQDVLTIPGSTLHWSLWHRARGWEGYKGNSSTQTDTMYVVIMPTAVVEQKVHDLMDDENLKEDQALTKMIQQIVNREGDYPDSTRLWEKKSSREWTYHNDDYIVGEEQYLTRFFFVAGSTLSTSVTEGNLLDDVRFGTELSPIQQGRGALSIAKIISGLSETQIIDDKYELELKITTPEGIQFGVNEGLDWSIEDPIKQTYSKTIILNRFTEDKGIYKEALNLSRLPQGEYKIEEVAITPKKYASPKSVSMIKVTDPATETGSSILQSNTTKSIAVGKVMVRAGELTSVIITNAYDEVVSFKVKKTFQNGTTKLENSPDLFNGVQFALYPADNDWKETSATKIVGDKIQLHDNEKDVIGIINFSDVAKGNYLLREEEPPTGYKQAEDKRIYVGDKNGKFSIYLCYENGNFEDMALKGSAIVDVLNEESQTSSGAILPDTGGPGLAMFERYGWFLLMLALMMAGVEVRCYGERKYRRMSVTRNEEFEEPV